MKPRIKRKYEQVYEETPEGWSEWIIPLHGVGNRNYRASCCDCGLVHEYQYRIKKDAKGRNSVVFRVRSNKRATSAIRRHISASLAVFIKSQSKGYP